MKQQKGWRMSCDVGKATESPFSNLSVTLPTSQLVFHPFRRFTYVKAHSPTPPLLLLRLSSFSNLSVTLPNVIAHFPSLPSLYLRRSSFPRPSVASSTSQLILQPFFRFSYVSSITTHLPQIHFNIILPSTSRPS